MKKIPLPILKSISVIENTLKEIREDLISEDQAEVLRAQLQSITLAKYINDWFDDQLMDNLEMYNKMKESD